MLKNVYPLMIVLSIACSLAQGEDWTRWRGPQYDGVSRDTAVTLPWTADPKVLWEVTIGPAFSAVSGAGDLVYTCGTEDDQQVLFCLAASNGEIVWKKAFAGEVADRQGGDGTRATPTVDDGRVYIFGGEGTLLCADAKTGDKIWSKEFDNPPRWKYSGSVLIEENLAIISPGGSDGGLLALNKETGDVVWKGAEADAGYATPYPFTIDGRRCICGVLAKEISVVDAETGDELWGMPWVTKYDVNAATPIYDNGHLFVSSGYGHGSVLVKLETDGDQLTSTTVWESKAILNKFQTCILLDGKLYGADERNFKCVDFLSGNEVWSMNRVAGQSARHGTLVLCQGQLVFLSEKGQLCVAKASPDGYDAEGASQVLDGRCWTVPTLHNGRLYVRNLEKLVCLDLGD